MTVGRAPKRGRPARPAAAAAEGGVIDPPATVPTLAAATPCPRCGQEIDARFRACGHCGTWRSDRVQAQETRRRITLVQSDLKGSTSLGEKLDPESLREVLTLYFDEMRAVLESYGGTIEKIIGDAIIAVFGLPVPRADDALRAVAAAAETQRALAAVNEQLRRSFGVTLINRTGIASGEVVLADATAAEHILSGDVVNLAARLEQAAPPLEVLIGEPTLELLRDAVVVETVDPVTPKAWTQPVNAYRLVHVNVEAAEQAKAPRSSAEITHTCVNCGEVNPPDFTFCGSCATRLRAALPARESRKTVTIVFADLKAVGSHGEPLPAAALRSVMARAFDSARRVLQAHGGVVEKFIGDAVMAVFGLPVRHEDDALRAVRAALDMRRILADLADRLEREEGIRLQVATGVNTGEVVAGDASLGQRLVTGDAVNVAARLEQAAPAHQVLIGELTHQLVRDRVDVEAVEPLALKGKSEPVAAYLLRAVRSSPAARRVDAPMVGREVELGRLQAALRAAVAGQRCTMVTLVGEAGVGKTRLTSEFLNALPKDVRVLSGRCLAYGDGITFWPVVEIVRQAAGIRDDDPSDVARLRVAELLGPESDDVFERVASAVGLLDATFQVPELFWGIRRFLELLAANAPLVVLFDDIHWAEPTFLDLVQQIVDASVDAPIVLLCTARNTLLEAHPDWATREHESRIELEPLTEADAEQVVAQLLGQAGVDEVVRRRIVEATEGNPLFLEQLLAMLIDNGTLRHEDGRWVAHGDLTRLRIPPSIHALIAARLDQLPDPERGVVEPASVIGLSFARDAVRELVGPEIQPGLPVHLVSLAEKELVRATPAATETEPGFRFQHALVRDAAYQGLLKRARADLHERFVAWADRVNAEAGRTQEFEEILGYHLEQAYRYLVELGMLDGHAVEVGGRASERLGSAGRRAFARGDMPAAANLLDRATSVLASGHASRPALLIRLGEARMEMGEFSTSEAVLDAAATEARAMGDEALAINASLVRLLLRYVTDPTVAANEIEATVGEAIQVLERAGDRSGLMTAWRFMTNLRMAGMQWGAAEAAATRLIEYARESGDTVMEMRAGPALALAALFGPTPVPQAVARCTDLLARSVGDRRSEAQIQRCAAQLRAMQGDFDGARSDYRQARRTLEELGWTNQAALTSLDSGPVELLAGDAAAAEAELRGDYQTLERLGNRTYISTVAALLGEALYEQGRLEEADHFVGTAEDTAAADDVTTQVLVRLVRGKLLGRAGRVGDGERLIHEAIVLTESSDELVAPASAMLDLAEVLCLDGRREEAAAATARAVELYDRKGDAVAARQARLFARGLQTGLLP